MGGLKNFHYLLFLFVRCDVPAVFSPHAWFINFYHSFKINLRLCRLFCDVKYLFLWMPLNHLVIFAAKEMPLSLPPPPRSEQQSNNRGGCKTNTRGMSGIPGIHVNSPDGGEATRVGGGGGFSLKEESFRSPVSFFFSLFPPRPCLFFFSVVIILGESSSESSTVSGRRGIRQ